MFYVGLVVDQGPRTTMSRSEALTCPMLFQPNAKVIRVADVKTRVRFRAKDVNVEHAAVLVTAPGT